MKKIIYIILINLIGFSVNAQSTRYQSAMESAVAQLDTSSGNALMLQVANKFERIANAEKTQWLPFYYAAYSYTFIGQREKKNNDKDANFERAEQLITKADSLNPDNSEIYTLMAYIKQGQIQVNPMSRGQTFGPIAGQFLDKAIALNSENPRAHLLKGVGLVYTPAMFGGGKDKGCPSIKLAIEKFAVEKNPDKTMPHWGREFANVVKKECE